MFRVICLLTMCFSLLKHGSAQQNGSFKDPRDGRVYKTVKIGEQVWMAENLNVDRFRNGDKIPEAKTEEEWRMAGKLKKPAWCYFNSDSSGQNRFGKIYNRYAYTDSRELCPSGFYLAGDYSWIHLSKNKKSTIHKLVLGYILGGYRNNGYEDANHEFLGFNEESIYWSTTGTIRWDSINLDLDLGEGDWDYDNSGFYVRCIRYSQESSKSIFIDKRDQRRYKTIKINGDTWMAENLNSSKFRNGDLIPEAKSNNDWLNFIKNKKPAWCYYNNNPANGIKYGKLYNWYAVNDPRGLAPEGYHVSTKKDWENLENYFVNRDSVGFYLKSKSDWQKSIISIGNGNDLIGFTAIAGGYRSMDGDFNLTLGGTFKTMIGVEGRWWTSSIDEKYINMAARASLSNFSNYLSLGSDYIYNGFSVRCVKD